MLESIHSLLLVSEIENNMKGGINNNHTSLPLVLLLGIISQGAL